MQILNGGYFIESACGADLSADTMATQDKCCTINPYFQVPAENLQEFKKLCERFVKQTEAEKKCLYYGFSFYQDLVHCREGYEDAEGVLTHIENVGFLLEESEKFAKLIRFEIHGPEEELAKLRKPLANLNPQFFVLEYGFRR